MPRLHTKQELQQVSQGVSTAMILRTHMNKVYEARDFATGSGDPDPARTVWEEKTPEDFMDIGRGMGILFANEAEFRSFQFMIRQGADRIRDTVPWVMIKHGDGLAYLTDDGIEPVDVTAGFTPNYVPYHVIDKDSEDYERVGMLFKIIAEWLDGDAQAHSLLHHLATALQPGYSARKYLLLLGKGSNGKGTLIKMIEKLLGTRNISGVFRQDMAARKAITAELNNKLMNLIYDGPATYVADSGPEKTFIAGEPVIIELKYENVPVRVQTNALFVEALNKEPKARDKSDALQDRLVRFRFPNKYEADLEFLEEILSERSIDAFLTLLVEHWVKPKEVSKLLKLSEASEDLQINYSIDTSPVLAWIEVQSRADDKLIAALCGTKYSADALVTAIQPWLGEQGYGERSNQAVWELLGEHFVIERRTVRGSSGVPKSQRVIVGVMPATMKALLTIQGDISDEQSVVRGE